MAVIQVDVSRLQPGASGDDGSWYVEADGSYLTINKGEIEFINGEVGIRIFNNATILGGTFSNKVTNFGARTILGGIFNGEVDNDGTILSGTFNQPVTIKSNGTISGGEFYKEVTNTGGVIKNLIAKDGFSLSSKNTNAEKITIVDNGVNINKTSFDKINNIVVEKDAKVIFSGVSIADGGLWLTKTPN